MDAMHESPQERGKRMLKESGYADGGAVKPTVKRGIHQHEDQEHAGKHLKLKLRRGGMVEGKEAGDRPDRRARGGAAKGVTVNVKGGGEDRGREQMAAQAGMKQGMRAGVALGARAAASRMAGGPPGAGGPPMGPRPPMAGPPMAPGAGGPPMKKGGKVEHVKVRAHERRKAGGKVEC